MDTVAAPNPVTDTPTEGSPVVDGIQMAILTSRMQGIIRKMTNTLFRTSRSGVISNARDFSCCIVTADNELLLAAESLPIHVMSGPDLMCKYMKEMHPNLQPGDAFFHNSPYHGNSHTADQCLLVPIFDNDGTHRFTAFVKAHLADVGNALPSTIVPTVRDVYEEGSLIFPSVQIQRDYQNIDDIIRMCLIRIRVPEFWQGDFNGMVGAGRIAEREMISLADEIGWDTLDEYVRQWFDYSEHLMVEEIRKLPAGKQTAHTVHDAFGEFPDVQIKATVEIDPVEARISVDLRDNPDCIPFGMNLTEATSRTAAMVGIFMSIDAAVPANAGSYRRLNIELRENCVVGIPRHPMSCSGATTNIADRTASAVQVAFAEMGEGIGLAEVGGCMPAAAPTISGVDPRHGKPFVDMMINGMTAGAGAPTVDAWLTAVHTGSYGAIRRASTEATELQNPVRIWVNEIETDTEGAGQFRGAPSNRVEWGPANTTVEAVWMSDGNVHPAQGVRGGLAGGRANQWIRQPDGSLVEADAFAYVAIKPDERVVSLGTGGGGYGHPLDRDTALVAKDVREGWVSVTRAADVYGVAVDASGTVDIAATTELRSVPRS